MSGSPIIQNGRLSGAVTHVLLDDSTKGYAIFAENMLETAQGVAEKKFKRSFVNKNAGQDLDLRFCCNLGNVLLIFDL